ncbi:MAG: type I glyceraldehyde-3-phosphate dehydrogenase [Deltaproteobacteria bacterium CG11_big_fil_rev_8_21_14_0_20_47_16]|nr:MAG: type I glyceraldehyde-3-phosphate dehydrogenase [Deltaproteobacteria bacterium CG11_big_fil_rev_8_21_14_0_20_47_16]
MGKIRVAINGFGRIGRNIVRQTLTNPKVEVVAINDLTDAATLAHLLKYDSIFGPLKETVTATDTSITVGDKTFQVTKEKDPTLLPWKKLGIDIALECTGRFTNKEDAAKHLSAGAKRVIISAPAKNEDITIVMGVNNDRFNPETDFVISNASCTTNCLAPFAKVLHETFGIEQGFMVTIHSYTNDQHIMDSPHKDLRRARAGAINQIPTSTGAAKAVGLVLPELNGKLDGYSIRVPTPDVSCVNLVATCKRAVTAKEVNDAFKTASNGALKGILGFSDEPLVSTDYIGCPLSSIIDGLTTKAMGNVVNVLSWYDNEAGFSHRMVDLTEFVGAKIA